ncbi:nucleotide exchange factor GrpE [SAR86 cluster bacterium]|jgi:Molecular chaperone GrpE (heat shock protein)|nr:nucleotide exchange factor GrpE [SAR86 cluster bacterium]|tara:strand:+ start:25 stop:600 length:576 start_codon:yes stop_codon:yes gene_type:complete
MEKTLNKDTKEQNQEKEENSAEEEVSLEIEENDTLEEPEEISQEEIIKDLEDQLLRAKAEVQNVRRIAAQEVTKARLFGVESLAKDFLTVADNLERAIEACGEEEQFLSVKEGLELTLKSLEGSLNSSSIEVIDTSNKNFDPEKHEAISLIEDDSLDTNTIIDVVQKGYTIMDRTLRPAKVVVSKKSQEKS